ncbi:MAG: hypothetical protein KJI69_05315 [Patescibacteria group bacterium]|nr:hypothetical protein [Patescibacteria group bacterium]
MKYIISKDNDVIIFSGGIEHRDMANKFGGAVSAGSINSKLEAYGSSSTLKISSREKDTAIIQNRFNQ